MPRLGNLIGSRGLQVTLNTMLISAERQGEEDALRIRYGAGEWTDCYAKPLYRERLAPLAAPTLLQSTPQFADLPRIAVSGPRPGWNEWDHFTGQPNPAVPVLRFDTFTLALEAAMAGLGVILGSLPLCQNVLSRGLLTQIGAQQLSWPQTYWLIGSRDRLSARQWDRISAVLCDQP